jgi:hypothetical protein
LHVGPSPEPPPISIPILLLAVEVAATAEETVEEAISMAIVIEEDILGTGLGDRPRNSFVTKSTGKKPEDQAPGTFVHFNKIESALIWKLSTYQSLDVRRLSWFSQL